MKVFVVSLLLVAGVVVSGSARAGDYGSKYDWRSGNWYHWNTDSLGNTRVQGFNGRTGSSWNTTIDQHGNMRGFDSRGGYWNYNSGTGAYWNSTGKSCFGKGALRTCN